MTDSNHGIYYDQLFEQEIEENDIKPRKNNLCGAVQYLHIQIYTTNQNISGW